LHSMKRPKCPPDVSPAQQASIELLKQIRKLRWIGEEDEALRRNSFSGALSEARSWTK
jgi:hypothetical protein